MNPDFAQKKLQKISASLSILANDPDQSHPSQLKRHVDELQKLVEQLAPPNVTLVRSGSDWSLAFLRQAKADLDAAKAIVVDANVMRSAVVAMLLQMVFEKIAKAWLARTDFPFFAKNALRSHNAAEKMTLALRRRAISKERQFKVFASPKWVKALVAVGALEAAHPTNAKSGPHLEYPWETPTGVLLAGDTPPPLTVVADIARPGNDVGPFLFKIAQKLIEEFDQLFPEP